MSDLPRVVVGQLEVSEEHNRALEAYWRKHGKPVGKRVTASDYNRAVDWWNTLAPEEKQP